MKLYNQKAKKAVPVCLLVGLMDSCLVSCLSATHALSGCNSTSIVGLKLRGLKVSIDFTPGRV